MDKIRTGRHHPRSIRIRALVSDGDKPWMLPAGVTTGKDAPALQEHTHSAFEHHLETLLGSVTEIAELGLVESATAEVRSQPAAPLFKLYIMNGREAFHGFYPVREHAVKIEGNAHNVFDFMGKDITLFHHEATEDPEAVGSQL
jgi:hypothetical protein